MLKSNIEVDMIVLYEALIGAVGYIEGNGIMIFLINFLYFLIEKKEPPVIAFEKSCELDEELKSMRIYQRKQ